MILLDALAVLIANAEVTLRLRVTFLRGLAHRFKRVPRFSVGGHFLSQCIITGVPVNSSCESVRALMTHNFPEIIWASFVASALKRRMPSAVFSVAMAFSLNS